MSREYAEQLKLSAKELIDGIGTDSERDLKIIKLIYGFAEAGFRESMAEKGDEIKCKNRKRA